MSALDQAFIKAYTKDSPAKPAPDGRAPARSTPPAVKAAFQRLAQSPAGMEDVYDQGTLYRVDPPQSDSTEAVPVPHFPARRVRPAKEGWVSIAQARAARTAELAEAGAEADAESDRARAPRPLPQKRSETPRERPRVEQRSPEPLASSPKLAPSPAPAPAATWDMSPAIVMNVDWQTPAPPTEAVGANVLLDWPATEAPPLPTPRATAPVKSEPAKIEPAAREKAKLPLPPPVEKPPVERPPVEEPSAESFAPVWEVDQFDWPDMCLRLFESQRDYFESTGQRLGGAIRDGLHVLAVTSSHRGEGRSTMALCLACCAAGAGLNVALLDADVDNPQLGKLLGLDLSAGWQDVVAGKSPLAEAAVLSLADSLTLFPLTGTPRRHGLRLDDPRVTRLVGEIAAHFELLIIDLGPLGADDIPFFAGETCPIDAAIVVRDLRATTQRQSLAAADRLRAEGVETVGIAENFGSA